MHTAPATNASFANVPSPGPSSLSQGSFKGTSTKPSSGQFQQVYENVSASNDSGTGDQAASKNASIRKKDSEPQSVNSVATTTPASQTNTSPLSPALALVASSVSTAQPASDQIAQETDAQASPSTQSPDSGSEAGNLSSLTQAIAAQSAILVELAPQKPLAKISSQPLPTDGASALATPSNSPGTNDEQTQEASNGTAANPPSSQTQSVRSVQSSRTFPPVLDLSSVDQTSSPSAPTAQGMESQKNSNASTQAPPPNAPAAKPLALSGDNLAFSLNLSIKADAGVASSPSVSTARQVVDSRSAPPTQQPAAASGQSSAETDTPPVAAIPDDAKILIAAPNAENATTSRPLPSVNSGPNESRGQLSPDSSPRQQQDSAASSSSQRTSSDATNQDTNERAQSGASDRDSTSDLAQNVAPSTNRPAQPSVTSWLAGDPQSDARSTISTPSRPATAESTLPASIQDLHAIAADAPKTTAPNEILLHLDNGQTSAAVRVVDRAGTVNVSVHASDQDLRTSLRTNLNDLSAQLNAQGVKTESTRAASSQGSSENRQDQGTHDQKSNGQQQHSSPQGDRQSPRGRRTSAQWLDELQEQTSPIVNPGGNHL